VGRTDGGATRTGTHHGSTESGMTSPGPETRDTGRLDDVPALSSSGAGYGLPHLDATFICSDSDCRWFPVRLMIRWLVNVVENDDSDVAEDAAPSPRRLFLPDDWPPRMLALLTET
ncbi:hypothetical protein, partial [Streptomyces sp. YGL11-2]|uniref:hypothetical protein n=1 Tax=Streptomyces sp. YGL11-2 TaxID=3414028 RepID=UPI003CEA8658